jgi:hypothetical protein
MPPTQPLFRGRCLCFTNTTEQGESLNRARPFPLRKLRSQSNLMDVSCWGGERSNRAILPRAGPDTGQT